MIRLFSNKTTNICITVIILFLVNIRNADSSSLYFDKDATGSGSGTSWINAVSACTGYLGNCELGGSPGDTWYISGGTTSKQYDHQFTITAPGVIIKPGASEPTPLEAHSGTVIINTDTPYGIRTSKNNVVIDGLAGGARKIKVIAGDRGINVDAPATNVLIRGVELTNNYAGIFYYNSFGEIDNCYIHNMRGTADAGIRGLYTTSATDYGRLIVHDSIISVPNWAANPASGYGADGIQSTNGLIAYNNYIESVPDASFCIAKGGPPACQHADAIQQTGSTYTKIYNNTLTGFNNFTLFLENSRNHIQIYNNYFYKTRGAVVALNRGSTTSATDFHIYNNTVVDCIGANYPAISYGYESGVSSGSDIAIRNNIVINCPSGIQIMVPPYDKGSLQCGTDIILDQNIGGVSCRGINYRQPTYGSISIPSFILYKAMNGPLNNMHPTTSDIVAKDKGGNLSPLFTTDKEGTSRPRGSGWDIGAYESIYSGKISMPPTKVKVQ